MRACTSDYERNLTLGVEGLKAQVRRWRPRVEAVERFVACEKGETDQIDRHRDGQVESLRGEGLR